MGEHVVVSGTWVPREAGTPHSALSVHVKDFMIKVRTAGENRPPPTPIKGWEFHQVTQRKPETRPMGIPEVAPAEGPAQGHRCG